ncbi:MAG: hypothetical protein R3F54_06405 [Alphaproteobacteria bacterium]
MLSEHLSPACEAFDLNPDDLAGLLGADVYFNLWGCAFEDFMTRDDEDDGNIVDDYLKRRGWKESAVVKANLKGLRSSAMSLYEVSGIEPGRSFLARDLVRGGEPVRVRDRAASSTVKPWDRIGAMLIKVGSKVEMGGGVLLFDHDGAEELLKALGRSRKRASKDLAELIVEADVEVDATSSAAAMAEGMLLPLSAFLFTTVWLQGSLEQVLGEQVPAFCNSDGEPLLFHELRFPLTTAESHAEVKTALDAAPMLAAASECFWNWTRTDPAAKPAADVTGKAGQKLISTLEDGSVVLGGIELDDNALIFSTNATRRAEQGQALLTDLLGAKLGRPEIEVRTIDELEATNPSEGDDVVASEIPPEVARSLLKDQLDRHYRETLDEPVPSLGNRSPRASLKTRRSSTLA